MGTQISLAAAMASGAAASWAGKYQPGQTREAALARIREITRDAEVLAEAAAMYKAPRDPLPWHPDAVELLVEAGADLEALERLVAERRNRKPAGLNLGKMAEGINKLPGAHG